VTTLRPRGVLIDLDGVVYNGQEPIPGAAAAVRALQEKDFPHLFVTNTTSRPRAALVGKLKSFGIETNAERILTPAVAAAAWLHAQPPGPVALYLKAAARAEFEGLEPATRPATSSSATSAASGPTTSSTRPSSTCTPTPTPHWSPSA